MMNILDKRDRARGFRDRLSRAMVEAGMTQTALARAVPSHDAEPARDAPRF